MIDEIRIMSKTGTNIFSGKIDLDSSEVEMSDTDVLFAGFISAILSISEELQSSDIRELGYQETKIIFTMTENLIFLGFVDTRVPNEEIQVLLDNIIRRWLQEYDDDEYPFVPEEMKDNILSMIQESIKEVFWWASPKYTLKNNIKLVANTFQNPSGSYYIRYLPKIFLLTGFLFYAISLLGGAALGVAFTGFASGNPIQGSRFDAFLATTVTLTLFILGTAAMMRLMFRDKFNIESFLIIGGIYSLILLVFFLFTSNLYFGNIYNPVFAIVEDNPVLSYAVEMILFFAPFNISFFGFIVLHSYSTSFNNTINTVQYFAAYLLSILFMISLSRFITRGLLGVIPG